MNKDLRQEIAKIITPAWPSSSLLRADKLLSLVYSHLEKKMPDEKGSRSIIQLDVYAQATREGQDHYQKEYGKRDGYNKALSEIKQILKKELLK
jgi:hypothetical protein